MVKEKKTGHVIVISGPSGAGKDTVVQKLLEQNKNIALSISMTTRAPRKGEEEGTPGACVAAVGLKKGERNGIKSK